MMKKLELLKVEHPHMNLLQLHNLLTTHQPISIQIVITANKVVLNANHTTLALNALNHGN